MAKRNGQPNHAKDWNAEFERTGSVSFQLAARRLKRLSAIGVVFLVAGIAMAVAGRSTGDRLVGVLAALMGAGSVVAFSKQLRQKGPAVSVDARGVTAHYTWRGEHLVPWAEIRDTSVYRTHGTAMVLLIISAEFESQWLSNNKAGGAGRALATANRSLVGAPSISLPSPLKLDPDELALWIGEKAEELNGG